MKTNQWIPLAVRWEVRVGRPDKNFQHSDQTGDGRLVAELHQSHAPRYSDLIDDVE